MQKILSVDDSSVIRRIIAGTVEVLGYDTIEASNGEEALGILKEKHEEIVLVLLDWNMPGMNGLELLQQMKANTRYAQIPVMMVTTESERENIIRALQAGAKHYLTKPFTQQVLAARIMECLGMGG
ncbi:MAG: response regulator [Pseudomonadota bacterium]